MNIVADENIPYVKQVFAPLGQVTTVSGRNLVPELLHGADLLLVRSVTRVNRELLQGSSIKYVATATIGTDHVDEDYLSRQKIGFASAPGCNAISAAEYVISALLNRFGLKHLQDQTVAIVGCGNVGSRVLDRLSALGVKTLAYDPPRQLAEADRDYVSWAEVQQASVVSAHVPLQRHGAYPTYHMFDENFFRGLPKNATFVNTARGDAVDQDALKRILAQRDDLQLVLDVWADEPTIDIELMQAVAIATPHIAGYSLDGKVRGTQMIFQSCSEFFNKTAPWEPEKLSDSKNGSLIKVDPACSLEQIVEIAVQHAYAIMEDDKSLRAMAQLPLDQRGVYFDNLRKHYPVRREFSYFTVQLTKEQQASCGALLKSLGFCLI